MFADRIFCWSLLVCACLGLACSTGPDEQVATDLELTDTVADRMSGPDVANDVVLSVEVGDLQDIPTLLDSSKIGDAVDAWVLEVVVDAVTDSVSTDSTVPLTGFGALSGECGVLDDEELLSDSPWLFINSIDFGADSYDESDFDLLSMGGQKVLLDENAGGSSTYSEVFSFEVLHRCELAALLKTEMEIIYEPPEGKITDLLVTIESRKIGVSVTRAVGFPKDEPYTVEQAKTLLDKKLGGIQDSSSHVASEDQWVKQVLHILAYADGHADALAQAYGQIDPALLGNTIVVVTVTDGDDLFIYE